MWRCVFFDDGRYITFYVAFFNARSKSNRSIGQISLNIFLSCQISANQCVKEYECKKEHRNICAKGNDVITNVIYTSQHFASTFSMQIFKFQTYHRAQRSYLWWQAKQRLYSWSYESPLITVESTMNLTYQTVMRSCYKPGKIWLNARWELASHVGVFRGARISSLPTNACSTENNIPFPLFYSRGKWPINSLK